MRASFATALTVAAALALTPRAASAQWVDFGDDSGAWALDGECDDPRFEGPGMFGSILDDHRGHDAADCRLALDTGEVTMRDDIINFGADAGQFALDGVCDDIRFEGPGMRGLLFGDQRGQDGTDCREAWDADEIELRTDRVVFGDDEGEFAGDGVCDDPRFQGPGMNPEVKALRGREGHDAGDCEAAFLAGHIEPAIRDGLYGLAIASVYDGIDFGDNRSARAKDGACDDARFAGAAMGAPSMDNVEHDAADCARAYLAGVIREAE